MHLILVSGQKTLKLSVASPKSVIKRRMALFNWTNEKKKKKQGLTFVEPDWKYTKMQCYRNKCRHLTQSFEFTHSTKKKESLDALFPFFLLNFQLNKFSLAISIVFANDFTFAHVCFRICFSCWREEKKNSFPSTKNKKYQKDY